MVITEPTKLLLSRAEVAVLLGLSQKTIERLQARGELPAIRVGRRVLSRRVVVERFVARRTAAAAR